MPTRPALNQTPIVVHMDGLARHSAHGAVRMRPTLIFIYQPDRPYSVHILIGRGRGCAHGPTHGVMPEGAALIVPCDCDLTPWMVSREVLCGAASWQTPAGMGDFRAVPMADHTTQLVFYGSHPDGRAEALHVDVKRKSLLEFLRKTMAVVKPGDESRHMDVDAMLAKFMDCTQ